jgi:AraC-like DNA-binding protein
MYIPPDILKPYVKRLVINEDEQANTYKVLPGAGIVMGFQYSGRLSHTTEAGLVRLSPAGITGLTDKYKLFRNSDNIGSVLVFFTETGAAALLSCPLHELFRQSLSLDDLIVRSQMDEVVDQLHEAGTDLRRLKVVEQFLISLITPKPQDMAVEAAVQAIRQHGGNIRISSLARQLCVSQNRLEKRFRAIVGASPKKFSSLVRFGNLLAKQNPAGNLTRVGLDAGYYDQAHFIKEFRSMTGETPEMFFKK